VLPQLRTDRIMAAPASLDALWVREENLLPVGAPYQIQAINAMDYYLSEGGGTTDSVMCTMIQDDVYGEAGQQGIDFAAQEYGFPVANTQRFKVGTENYVGQIGALAGAGCEMVFLVATPSDAAKIWGTAAQAKYAPQWFGQSPAYTGALAQSPVAPYMQQSVLMVSEGTEWGDESVPGMKQMVADATEFAPDQEPDYYFAFGYNQARAMTALLEKAVELGDLSREGILEASNQLGEVTFDGLAGDYQYGAAETRNPPRSSTIFAVDPTKPFGLKTVKYNFTSDAAGKFEFENERSLNPYFSKFVDETERRKESRKLELNGYLTKPTTRLARYPLLLDNVLKYTEPTNQDKEDIPKAMKMIRDLLTRVNAESGKAENRFNLKRLHEQLRFRPNERVDLKLTDPGREHRGPQTHVELGDLVQTGPAGYAAEGCGAGVQLDGADGVDSVEWAGGEPCELRWGWCSFGAVNRRVRVDPGRWRCVGLGVYG